MLPKIAVVREALHRALPPKVVVLSTIGADAEQPNLLNVLRLLEEALADLPVAVTFLRAAWFMENAQWDIASARDEGVIDSYLQPLDRPVAMVATAGVGRTAAELLLVLDGFNEGWIDFRDADGQRRKGRIGIDEAIVKIIVQAGR
ncbi:hypothetical protein [Mesorhizobium sp. B4-1-3]|uniref:hypothetical protein n=1 Tax=Mesorhizobium sp. B4-1-3 TaxID=2589889 RepID=UPI001AED87AA|nr:hypothetical protein [Mesorhizobium sp. B4-1-3]